LICATAATEFEMPSRGLHLGVIVVGLPCIFNGKMGITLVHGVTPYGASTIAGSDSRRMPSAVEVEAARFQGRPVAVIADGRSRACTRALPPARRRNLARAPPGCERNRPLGVSSWTWSRGTMRYYFRLTNGKEELRLPEGADLPGNATAREEAVVLARELKHGRVMPGRDWAGWFVAIVDQHGHKVDSIPIADVPDADVIA
jgi:Domain of unknown function (DUF6894)